MYSLLLNSSSSEDVDLHILPTLGSFGNKIIKVDTGIPEEHRHRGLEGLVNFLSDVEHLHDVGKAAQAVAIYHLEQFFGSVEQSGRFSSVRIVGGEHGKSFSLGGYRYEFVNGGRTISVYTADGSRPVTDIARLVEISRGTEKQVVICDVVAGKHLQWKNRFRIHRASKVDAVKALLGEGASAFTLSYMLCMPSDTFYSSESVDKYAGGGLHAHGINRSFLQQFLDEATSLCMVFSGTSQYFATIASNALSTA